MKIIVCALLFLVTLSATVSHVDAIIMRSGPYTLLDSNDMTAQFTTLNTAAYPFLNNQVYNSELMNTNFTITLLGQVGSYDTYFTTTPQTAGDLIVNVLWVYFDIFTYNYETSSASITIPIPSVSTIITYTGTFATPVFPAATWGPIIPSQLNINFYRDPTLSTVVFGSNNFFGGIMTAIFSPA